MGSEMCIRDRNRTDPTAPDRAGKTVLGQEQLSSLRRHIHRGEHPWLILGMPSKLLSLEAARGDADIDLVLRTLKLSDKDGRPFHDRWDAFSHERDQLLHLMEDSASRVVVLCGDVHFAAFSETSSRRVAECVTPSVTSPNFDDKMGWTHGEASRAYESKLVERVPDLAWCDLDRHGYLIAEVSADRFTCEWWGVTAVSRPSGQSELLHRVELERETM